MTGTSDLSEKLIEEFNNAFIVEDKREKDLNNKYIEERKKEQLAYSIDDIDPLSNSDKLIPKLINRVDQNREYRKERFLQLLSGCSGYPDPQPNSPYTYVAKKANQMLEQTRKELGKTFSNIDKSLKDHLRFYLFDRKGNDIFVKPDTINHWFGVKNNTPSRRTLILLSFALDLPLSKTDDDYCTHESLFYRVFGQRSRTRNVDEICMLYCKMTKKSYATAIKMYLDFLQREGEENHSSFKDDSKVPGTLGIYNKEIFNGKKIHELTEGELVDFLIINKDLLDFKSSHINEFAIELQKDNPRFLQEIIEDCEDNVDVELFKLIQEDYFQILEDYEDIFHKEYPGYMKEIYNNSSTLQIMDNRGKATTRRNKGTELTGALPKRTLFSEYMTKEEKEKNMKTPEEIFFPDPRMKKRHDLFLDFAIEVLPLGDYFSKISRYTEDYYTKQRKRWVFLLFLFYFKTYASDHNKDKKTLFNNYIAFTNQTLTHYYFSNLLPYNDYDSLFILCAQRDDPIHDYFRIIDIMYTVRREIKDYGNDSDEE